MLAFRPSALALVLLALSSCAYAPGSKGFPWDINFSGFVCNQNPTQFIEGVDWSQAKTIDLRIRQGHFSPTYFSLYVGQPYLLNIENADDVDHTFMAFDFFRAIAVAGVGTQGLILKKLSVWPELLFHHRRRLHYVSSQLETAPMNLMMNLS